MKTNLPKVAAPAKRALDAAGITCLEDLTVRTEKEIFALHGMGAKVMVILNEALKSAGLKFAD